MVGILEEAGCEDDVELEQLVVQWAVAVVPFWWYAWV